MPQRYVFDSDVIVAAFRSDRGASRRLLLLVLDGRLTLLLSVPLMLEYEAVLKRPEHLKAAGLGSKDIDAFLDALAAIVVPVPLRFLWRPMLKDPGDEMVLETAVNGQADCIVTFNLRHFEAGAARFGISASLPGVVLKSILGVPHAQE